MSITLKPGARLFSSVCTTEMIAVKAPAEAVELTIGGAAGVDPSRTPPYRISPHLLLVYALFTTEMGAALASESLV